MQTVTKGYPDVKQMLLRISTYEDTVNILDRINKDIIMDGSSLELRSMRQKVYDIRRRLKLVPGVGNENRIHVPQESNVITNRPTYAISYAHISLLAAYGLFAVCSGALIFIQSLEIYKRATFDHPILATCGALLLVCAASIMRAIKPSKITLMLCIYALSYESYLMVSGTLAAETVISSESVASDPRLEVAQMASESARESYEKARATYESNHNSWYKAKYVEPAKAKYMASMEKIASVKGNNTTTNFSLLKILYRLGLLFLFSLSVSLLISRINYK